MKLRIIIRLFIAASTHVFAQYRTDGRCGAEFGGALCDPQDVHGACCSSSGFCGSSINHCDPAVGCQSGCQLTDSPFDIEGAFLQDDLELPHAANLTVLDDASLHIVATKCTGLWHQEVLKRAPAKQCQVEPFSWVEFAYAALEKPCQLELIKTGYAQGSFRLEFAHHDYRETSGTSSPSAAKDFFCPPSDPELCIRLGYPHHVSRNVLDISNSYHHGKWVVDTPDLQASEWQDAEECIAHTKFHFSWRLVDPMAVGEQIRSEL